MKMTHCKWCSQPTRMLGTKMCDGCWELDRRIRCQPMIARAIYAHYHSQPKSTTPLRPLIDYQLAQTINTLVMECVNDRALPIASALATLSLALVATVTSCDEPSPGMLTSAVDLQLDLFNNGFIIPGDPDAKTH